MATTILPIAPPASALPVNADFTIETTAAGTAVILVKIMISPSATYRIAINGTTISDTFAILLIPPITTSPTQRVRIIHVITVLHEYVLPNSETTLPAFGSKKFVTADEILFT